MRAAVAAGTIAAMVSWGVVIPAVGPQGPASAAPTAACQDIATAGTCRIDYADYPDGATFTVPEGYSEVTLLVAGATGGGGGQGYESAGPGGPGALIIGTLSLDGRRDFLVRVGESGGRHDGGDGWSRGGDGGHGRGEYADGGGGGGSTGISFVDGGSEELIAVAAGGGGGGGNVSIGGDTASGGGGGGQGGGFDNDGDAGSKLDASNGAGGSGAGAGGPDGDHGDDAGPDWDFTTSTGGGAGGGGYRHGGGPGGNGMIASCNIHGNCPPDPLAGAGGGGGAGDSYRAGFLAKPDPVPDVTTAAPGHGYVIVYLGTPEVFRCSPTQDGQDYPIPSGIERYAVVMAGGAGTRGHSASHEEGTGALLHGILDVRGISTMRYWVGCSGYNGSYGWGTPGSGGSASSSTAKDGGDGGAGSLLLNADTEAADVFAAAGGGGGSGGDAACVPSTDTCAYFGGHGGSGGGVNGTRFPYDGGSGSGKFDNASGGCADCMRDGGDPDSDGGEGSGSSLGGGGGGGGSGYPAGGDGGNARDDGSGGGGGAGGSYVGTRMSETTVLASGSSDNGYILLIPMPAQTTTLTVDKVVTGDGAPYGTDPFTVEITCTVGGTQVYQRGRQLDAGSSTTFTQVPAGSTCDVVETGTGDATVPAESHTVRVGNEPLAITLTNRFDLAELTVTVESVVPEVGTHFTIDQLDVHLECTFDGRTLQLPDGGSLHYTGPDTWNATVSRTVQVPVGAVCGATQAPPTGSPVVVYSADSVVVEQGSTLAITDTYELVPLTIGKVTSGDGTPPDGVDYSVDAGCTFNGEPVVLAVSSVMVAADASAQVPNLPHDAVCDVTETDQQGAGTVRYTPSRTVVIDASSSVTVDNVYVIDPLVVSVTPGGAGASWLTDAMNVHLHVVCKLDGVEDPVLDQTYTLPATGGHVAAQVDVGAGCTIEQTDSAGATAVAYPLGTSAIIPGSGSAALEVANRYDVAPLAVTSGNSGAGAQYANGPTAANVDDCTFNGVVHDYSVSLPFPVHGGSGSATGIVVGAECDVTQSAGAGATTVSFTASNTPDSTPITDGLRVTVAADGPTTVAIDNEYELAALAIETQLAGAAAWAANTPTVVEVACRFNDRPVHRIGPNGVATLEFSAAGDLQPGYGATALQTLSSGTVCSAVETQTGGGVPAYLPTGDGRSGEVTAPATITITNDFAAASLSVGKILGGNDADAHVDDGFLLHTLCTFNGIPLAQHGTNPSWLANLTGEDTATYTELPVGAECTTTETASNHATLVLPSAAQSVTLGADGATLSFQNVFDTAPLLVRQVNTGAGAAFYGDPKVFNAKVDCSYPGGSRHELPDDGFFPLSAADDFERELRVPVGVTCSIDERNENHATELTLSPPQTVATGDTALLEATTRFDLASIRVETIAYGTDAATAEFDYTTTCVWPDPSQAETIPTLDPGDAAFAQSNGVSRDIRVLMNTFCTVMEVGTSGALRLVVTTEGARTALVPDGADAELFAPGQVAFVFSNYLPGSLPVTGAEIRWVIGAMLVLLVGGAALLAARAVWRRRSPAPQS